MEVKQKKGVIRKVQTRNLPEPVQIFEKKLDKSNFYLHIGLHRLPFFQYFRKNLNPQEKQQLIESLQAQNELSQQTLSQYIPRYSLGHSQVLSLSRYPLRKIVTQKMNSDQLEGKVLLFSGELDKNVKDFEFEQIYPYTFLSPELQQKSYTELISSPRLYDDLLTDKQVYKIEEYSQLDPKLVDELLGFFRAALNNMEVRYLHFQSLLRSIEHEYELYEEFEF